MTMSLKRYSNDWIELTSTGSRKTDELSVSFASGGEPRDDNQKNYLKSVNGLLNPPKELTIHALHSPSQHRIPEPKK